MSTMDSVMRRAVALASSGTDYASACNQLVQTAAGDRTTLEVAHAVILRDGLPRVRCAAPRRAAGSLRNRTLNLIELAISQTSIDGGHSGQFEWNQILFDA